MFRRYHRRIIFVGQHIRNIRMNLPVGAGSQFNSLSAPGEVFYRAQARSLRSAQLLEHLPQRVQGNASARAVEALPWMLSKVF